MEYKMFVVTQDGFAITDKMTMQQIIEKFGDIKQLEAAGLRVIEV